MKRSRKAIAKAKEYAELDGYVRKIVFARDGNVCVVCGKPSPTLQAAHILPKGRYPRLRFDPFNVLAMCFHDHMARWHKDPMWAAAWMEGRYPGRYDLLLFMARSAAKIDVKLLRIVLQAEVAAL
jgi:hypothetical protein